MNSYLGKTGSATLNFVSVTFRGHLLCFMHPPMLPLLFQEVERKTDPHKRKERKKKKETVAFFQTVANITVIYITATPRTMSRQTGRISVLL